MGAIISLILCPITIPVKLFRALVTFVSFLWIGLLIALVTIVALNWRKVKDAYENVVTKLDDAKESMDKAKTQIDDLSTKIDSINT